jgi:hypothetical protein
MMAKKPTRKNDISIRYARASNDGRTNVWSVTCSCSYRFNPITTVFKQQRFQCPKCARSYTATYGDDPQIFPSLAFDAMAFSHPQRFMEAWQDIYDAPCPEKDLLSDNEYAVERAKNRLITALVHEDFPHIQNESWLLMAWLTKYEGENG